MPEGLMTAVLLVVTLTILASVIGYGARFGWLFELATHFRLQYAWVLLISAVLLACTRRWLEAALAAGFALANVALVRPLRAWRAVQVQGPRYRLLLANVYSRNCCHERLLQLIAELKPDIAVLEEVNARWLEALRTLEASYPFSKSIILQRGFGIACYSRLPVEQAHVVYPRPDGLPSLTLHLRLADQRLMVISTHPHSPARPSRMRLRNQHLEALAEFIQQQQGPLMVVGDLNVTPWSPAFQDFINTTRLLDSRVGFGLQPTWPAFVPPVMIPLDHCLVSSEIVVCHRQRGPFIGSDHLPVIVEFALKP